MFLVFFSCLFFSCDVCHDRVTAIRKNVTNIAYREIITRKFLDPTLRDQPVFIGNDSEKYQFYNIDAYNKARLGDSIIKIAGTLKHLLKQKDTAIIFYPKCGLEDIKDLSTNE
jgi:hypothetical protein